MAIFDLPDRSCCGGGDGSPWWRLGGWRGCGCCAPRSVVLTASTTMSLLTGGIYFGWASLASIMLKSGSFASLCSPADAPQHTPAAAAGAADLGNINEQALCDLQEAAVQHLYSFTLFVMMFASLFAGTFMDAWGPRSTALLGYGLNVLASVCLASTRWFGDSFLYLGCLLLGAATDTGFLPLLTTSRLFPRHSGFIICILGSAASASFGVPPVLEVLAARMQLQRPLDVFWGYAIGGPGLCLLLTCLFIPHSGFLQTEPETAATSTQQPLYEELLEPSAGPEYDRHLASEDGNNMRELVSRKIEEEARAGDSTCSFICSREYAVLAIYFVVFSCAIVFYQEAPSRYFHENVVRALEAALPFSFVPCLLLGWVADVWGVIAVMALASGNGALAYACALWGRQGWLGYLSVLCFSNCIAVFTSQIFMYAEERFPSSHFGRLVGSLQLIGGAAALVCNPVYSAVVVSHRVSLALVTKTFIVLLLAQNIWLICLWRMQKSDRLSRVTPEFGTSKMMLNIGKA
ncbi:hypothetical protein ACSSS7_003868 [Eimeria intestinalis]